MDVAPPWSHFRPRCSRGSFCLFAWSQSSSEIYSPPRWCLSQSVHYVRSLSCSLELCATCGSTGTDPKHVSTLGGTKVKIAGTFVASSIHNTSAWNSSISNTLNRSWKTLSSRLVLQRYQSRSPRS